jgi:hypothetical protein
LSLQSEPEAVEVPGPDHTYILTTRGNPVYWLDGQARLD